MLNNVLNAPMLEWLLPHLTVWSLGLSVTLWCIHCFRLYRRWKRCWPRWLQYKSQCDNREVAEGQIHHENELMNQRLTWLMTAEGLLFTALGFALSKDNAAMAKQLIPVLSFVGILLAASASIVLDAADAAIIRWSPAAWADDPGGDVIGYRGLPLVGLLAPWRIFPPMFIVAWYLISRL